MNIQISVFIPFSGATEGLDPIVSALAKTLVDLGYGVKKDSDELVSLITVDESELSEWSTTTDFAAHLMRTAPMWGIPKEERDDSTRD